MKLPWDRKYIQIGFHIIVTLIIFYILKLLIDSVTFTIKNLDDVFSNMGDFSVKIISIFAPVVTAFVIAYIFDPVVDFFQKKFDNFTVKKPIKVKKKKGKFNLKKRTAGTIITYIIFILLIISGSTFAVLKLSGNSKNFRESPAISIMNSINEFSNAYQDTYNNMISTLIKWGFSDYIIEYILNFINKLSESFKGMGDKIVSSIEKIGAFIPTLLIALVIAFYFMKDKEYIKQKAMELSKTFLPKKADNFIRRALGDIDAVFSGYIRGTMLDALIMSILLSIALSLVGVKFAIAIGIISGFSNFIPYFGSIMGFILAVTVALFSGEPSTAIYAAIVVIILQQIDTIYIVPKVVGNSVELSPVMVIISLAVAGNIFGITGMIFAVPVCATVKIFLSRFIARRKEAV